MAHGMSLEALGKNAEAKESYKKVSGEKYKAQADYKIKTIKS